MLTFFSCPKAFQGHINIIQRNAIQSWMRLEPRPRIILFGNDHGIDKVCREFDLVHIPDIKSNEYGTPFINLIFKKAQINSKDEFLCYVNTDILLMDDFVRTFQLARNEKPRFFMIGRRWDFNIKQLVRFKEDTWREKLKQLARQNGSLHGVTGLDYFIFPRGFYSDIPAFAIGRGAWDNWLIYYARSRHIPVIDATASVLALHQNHDYSHIKGGQNMFWKGKEAEINLKLAGGLSYLFDIADATYLIQKNKVRPALTAVNIWRYFYRLTLFYPFLRPVKWGLDIFLKVTKVFRVSLRLTGSAAARKTNIK
ncbi:MAG: hypothetical protein PHF84_02880 [bacterium]|nr:hypothetical protein [bacterium]